MPKIAVITGASSGLGREIALRVHGYFPEIEEILLVARRTERLDMLAHTIRENVRGISVKPVSLDLSERECFDRIKDFFGSDAEISLLVNCAGLGFLGSFDASDMSDQLKMIDVNISALTGLTHVMLPYMPTGARIINIASVAAFSPNPRLAVYSATKSYVKAFGRALGYELRDRSISITTVCPGPMATEFVDVGRISGRSKRFESLPYTLPEKAAEKALNASKKRKTVVTPGIFFKLARILFKILPTRLTVYFSKV